MDGAWKEKVRNLMNEKGINQKQLSKETGITESSISRYLSGERTPRIDIIMNFAEALGVNPDSLLNETSENDNAYDSIAYAIARNGNKLSKDEQQKLINMLLGKEEDV